tara:strand:- start:570 stop:953 length:384 start_codon:yes stop_codon:yes gene_type:complete
MKPTSRNILECGHFLITAFFFPSFVFSNGVKKWKRRQVGALQRLFKKRRVSALNLMDPISSTIAFVSWMRRQVLSSQSFQVNLFAKYFVDEPHVKKDTKCHSCFLMLTPASARAPIPTVNIPGRSNI